MDAMQILVIILSIVLAIFLVLSIVLTILLIKITKQIQEISTRAETVVSRASTFMGNVAKLTSPTIMFDTVKNTVERLRKEK